MKKAYWIKHTHVFRKDEYVCSLCRHKTDKQTKNCPGCGRIMYGVRSDTNWGDEMEGIDAILDD